MPALELFETDADRSRERTVADAVAQHWGRDLYGLPRNHALDYAFTEKGTKDISFFVEIRTKNLPFGAVPDVYCRLSKLNMARLVNEYGLQTLFVVRWSCGTIGYTKLLVPDNFLMAGRSKTNQRNEEDFEPLAIFNNDRFTKLKIQVEL
jgi:hypothetical protein